MISSFFGELEPIVVIRNIEEADEGKVIVFDVVNDAIEGDGNNTIEGWEFVQTQVMTEAGIAVHKYGTYIIPKSAENTPLGVMVKYRDTIFNGNVTTVRVGATVGLTKSSDDSPI